MLQKTVYIQFFLISLLVGSLTSCSTKEERFTKFVFKTDYLLASEIQAKLESDTVPWKNQLSAVDYANKGDYKNALAQWDMAMGYPTRQFEQSELEKLQKQYSIYSAQKYIVDEAAKHKVTIINEAHHNGLHRKFTKSLLKSLYQKGYTHLGLEALGNGKFLDAGLNKRKYPLLSTGHYIKEPQFGNLVREALEIGFVLFPYEDVNQTNGRAREIAQARNIQQVMQENPSAKILIHCGYEHAWEGKHRSWEVTMAGRLKEFTGVDPFTIDQVYYHEKGEKSLNNIILNAFEFKEASVLLAKDSSVFSLNRGESYTDVAVFHPLTNFIVGRPHWVFEGGNEKLSIDLSGLKMKYPLMVLVYNEGENIESAVPVDIAEVASALEYALLGVKHGKYHIVVTNKEESFRFAQRFEIISTISCQLE